MLNVINHFFPKLWIGQTLKHLVCSSVMHPWGENDSQHSAAGHIGILVKGNTDSFLFSCFQKVHYLVYLIPVFLSAHLKVGIMDFHPRFPADFDDLFHGIQNGVCFASLMDDKDSVIFSHYLTHLDDFQRLGISAGHVD